MSPAPDRLAGTWTELASPRPLHPDCPSLLQQHDPTHCLLPGLGQAASSDLLCWLHCDRTTPLSQEECRHCFSAWATYRSPLGTVISKFCCWHSIKHFLIGQYVYASSCVYSGRQLTLSPPEREIWLRVVGFR